MFDRNDDDRRDRDRGQVGIGTLIVFIAMVLVAAIAAGVLINTAGFLQSKSEAAGQQSGQQVTNRLQVISATGQVNRGGGASTVSVVNVTVKKAPGSSNIDLENATVSWVSSGGTYKLVDSTVDAAGADGHFGVTAFKDADGSHPVLNDPDDRMVMTFDLGTTSTGVDDGSTSAKPDVKAFGNELGEGSLVTVKITTKSGATTTARLVVPQSLSGTSAVNL
ncbi:MAG: archaellin/type IV pilin N-terminal domain-containing protein [Halapricum sp.]